MLNYVISNDKKKIYVISILFVEVICNMLFVGFL